MRIFFFLFFFFFLCVFPLAIFLDIIWHIADIRYLFSKEFINSSPLLSLQVDGKRGPRRPKMTWKQLTERDCREWKLSAINPHDIPGDLVWDLPCMQQASYLEGGPLVWMLPLYLHVNQKSAYDDIHTLNGDYAVRIVSHPFGRS